MRECSFALCNVGLSKIAAAPGVIALCAPMRRKDSWCHESSSSPFVNRFRSRRGDRTYDYPPPAISISGRIFPNVSRLKSYAIIALTVVGIFVLPIVAQAQLQFTEVVNGSVQYYPYLPGMNVGEVGISTVTPNNSPTVPPAFIDTNFGGNGSATSQSPAEYLPDSFTMATQTLKFEWNLPSGFNPNQTLKLAANLNVATADGGSTWMKIVTMNCSAFTPGWQNFNGGDNGGSWNGSATANIAQAPSGYVMLQGKTETYPLPGTGQLALIKFGLSMATVPSP